VLSKIKSKAGNAVCDYLAQCLVFLGVDVSVDILLKGTSTEDYRKHSVLTYLIVIGY
jgi:hypothetical protein